MEHIVYIELERKMLAGGTYYLYRVGTLRGDNMQKNPKSVTVLSNVLHKFKIAGLKAKERGLTREEVRKRIEEGRKELWR